MSLPIHRPHGQLERERGTTGCLGSSPIVANLTASPDGPGLTREELERQRSARKNRFPIHQFRQSLPLDLNLDAPPPFDLPVYTSTLLPEQSFHSTLLTTFSLPTVHSNVDIPQSFLECTVLLIYHIPPSVILDPYQIDQLHTDGVMGDSVRFFGDIELELPLSRLSDRARDGSGLILEFDLFQQKEKNAEGNTERNIQIGVPLHGRYLEPKRVEEERSERTVDIEWPWVGLKCPLSPSSSSAVVSGLPSPFPPDLFSSMNQTLYSFRTSSSVLSSKTDRPLTAPMVLPVGDSSRLSSIEISTAIAVWLGAVWVGWCIYCRVKRGRDDIAKPKVE